MVPRLLGTMSWGTPRHGEVPCGVLHGRAGQGGAGRGGQGASACRLWQPAASVPVGAGRGPEAVGVQQQPGIGLLLVQRRGIGRQLGLQCVAPCQQQVDQRALAQRVGTGLQLGAALDLRLRALQLFEADFNKFNQ